MRSPFAAWVSATTDGTRLEPSSPGITTGVSPCMYATSELVVPKSIPTMCSSDMFLKSVHENRGTAALGCVFIGIPNTGEGACATNCCLSFQDLIHVAHQISDIRAPIQQR